MTKAPGTRIAAILPRWYRGKRSRQRLRGGGQAEASEDLPLAFARARGHDDGAKHALVYQDSVNGEIFQQRFGGAASFGQRRVRRHALPVEPFEQLMRLQSDVQQAEQRFDAARRFQKDRPDSDGRFPLVMVAFEKILFLVLREQHIGAGGDRRLSLMAVTPAWSIL